MSVIYVDADKNMEAGYFGEFSTNLNSLRTTLKTTTKILSLAHISIRNHKAAPGKTFSKYEAAPGKTSRLHLAKPFSKSKSCTRTNFRFHEYPFSNAENKIQMNSFDLKESANVAVKNNSTNSLASFIWILGVTYFSFNFEGEQLILASLRGKGNKHIDVVFAKTFPCSSSYAADNAHFATI